MVLLDFYTDERKFNIVKNLLDKKQNKIVTK